MLGLGVCATSTWSNLFFYSDEGFRKVAVSTQVPLAEKLVLSVFSKGTTTQPSVDTHPSSFQLRFALVIHYLLFETRSQAIQFPT